MRQRVEIEARRLALPADFLVGGQVPIPSSSAFGQTTVEYKDYGIKLHLEPFFGGRRMASIGRTRSVRTTKR